MDSVTSALAEASEAFFGAVRRGEARRVQELLHAHPTVLERPDPGGKRPLMVALSEGHGNVVEVLLKKGANHSQPDMSGNSPLHVVAGKGNFEALGVFLKNVQLPHINCTNGEGDSVLMGPAGRGFSIIVECLLQHNADPNITNKAGRTPIMEAARKGHKEVIKVLLRFGADILLTSHEDYSGMPTTLREAVAYGSTDITSFVMQHCNKAAEKIKQLFLSKTTEEVDDLIRNGCSVNHRRGDGCTALMVHSESGNVGVVCRLLDSHAFMDAQDMRGQTALMKSSFRGRLEVVQEMIRRGALIDLRCKEGRTAVMYGVMGKSVEVTKFLTVSGADLTITDNSGRTALDLSQDTATSDYLKKQKSSSISISGDPFTATVTEYLQKQKNVPKQIEPGESSGSADSPSQQRRQQTHGRPKSGTQRHGGEGDQISEGPSEEDPMKHQLNTYIKRVAELETRVEELTIRAEYTVMDEEDLSHYRDQPDRLIEEHKKLKTAKKKAEQFAVEAKQSAQKASVELTQLKEQLVMEKHSNELRLKHMMSDMEETLAVMEHSRERNEAAYKVIKKALGEKKLADEYRVLPTHEYSPEEVLNVIVKGNIKTRFKVTLVAVGGLPGSGKSTLVDKLVPKINSQRIVPALGMYEVAYCSTSRRDKLTPEWGEFTRDDIHMFMLTRALTDNGQALPILKQWSGNALPPKSITDKQLYNYFEKVYCDMHNGLLKFAESESDFRFHVMTEPNYVLLNLFDIGVSKALNESLPLISRLMQPIVLLNMLNLHRDGHESLRHLPILTDVHKAQHVMNGRSRGHYCTRIGGFCRKPGRSILIGTHRDKLNEEDAHRMKMLTEAGIRAKMGDMCAGESMESDMLVVNLHDQNDVEKLRRHIEEVINSTPAFNHDLHLTWIFLRSALNHYTYQESDFRMPWEDFYKLACECGLKAKEDIEKALKFFTHCGSLMYDTKFFGDNVIYNPQVFFQKLNALYDPEKINVDDHYKSTVRFGILCTKLAEEIWRDDKDFFWELMQKAAVGVNLSKSEYAITCPHDGCEETELLFVSTLRTGRCKRKEGMKKDSLYITFNGEYMPGDFQVQFVKNIKPVMPGIKLKHTTEYYNLTEFELPNGGSFRIIVHGDVVELVVKGYKNSSKLETETKSIIKATCVEMLDSVLKYFPGFNYQLGLLCTDCRVLNEKTDPAPNNNITSYLHFLPTDCENELYCRDCGERTFDDETYTQGCGKMIQLSDGQKRWMTLSDREFQGATAGEKCYEARIVAQKELFQIVKLIPVEVYGTIFTTLGPGRTSYTSVCEETIVTLLTDWQKQHPSNRRETLARILLKMGCYKAAIKLDAKKVPQDQAVSAVEMEILCNCAIQWRLLATELGLAGDTAREIAQFACTSDRERCRRVLQVFSTEKDSRKRISEALHKMGWTSAAKSLECGYINT